MKSLSKIPLVFAIYLMSLLSGCVSNEEYIRDLRAAMADSSIRLTDAVRLAETEVGDGICVRGALLVNGAPIFSVAAVAEGQLHDVRVDPPSGEVVSDTLQSAYGADLCTGGLGMVESLAIAEERANGVAVAVVPDDDVACAREIQVLSGDELWEVKVAQDGRVLEVEESDEDGSGDDD